MNEERQYVDVPLPDGMRRYEGPLGSFTYNPREFEIQAVDAEETDFGAGGRGHVLRYIGNDTDGSQIVIPDGLVDGSMTFMGTDIETMPILPASLRTANSMFANCRNLRSVYCVPDFGGFGFHAGLDQAIAGAARKVQNLNPGNRHGKLPDLEESLFMFANCGKLEEGPDTVSSVHADYMFTGCKSLKNTPKLSHKMESAECMLAGCYDLKEKPKIPGSMRCSMDITYGCVGIDAAEDRKAAEQLAKDRAKFEKKLNAPTFRQRAGRAFSAMLQVHVMRQMGYGIIMAPVMTHMLRKNGVFSRDFSNGVSQAMMSGRSGFSRMLGKKAGSMGKAYDEKLKASREQKMSDWDAMHQDAGIKDTLTDKFMRMQAYKDHRTGLFTKLWNMSEGEKSVLRERYSLNCQCREDGIREHVNAKGDLDTKDRQQMAKWYTDQISGCAAYYAEAMQLVNRKGYSVSEREHVIRNLREVSAMQLEPLIQSAERMQSQYQVFDEKDLRMITRLTKDMPSEKRKVGTFYQRNQVSNEEMRRKVSFKFSQVQADHAKKQQDRAARAEARFGGSSRQGTAPDPQFE